MKVRKKRLAKMCGISKQAVSMAQARGQITDDVNGLLDITDPTTASFLRAHGRTPDRITEADILGDDTNDAGHVGRCALDAIPSGLRDRTIEEILRDALPSGGRSVPPSTWIFLWQSVQRAKLFAHDNDPEKEAFQGQTGLPWAVAHLNLQSAIHRVVMFEHSLLRPPHWTVIFRELCLMFGIKNT